MKRILKTEKPAKQQEYYLQDSIGMFISLTIAVVSLGSIGLFV